MKSVLLRRIFFNVKSRKCQYVVIFFLISVVQYSNNYWTVSLNLVYFFQFIWTRNLFGCRNYYYYKKKRGKQIKNHIKFWNKQSESIKRHICTYIKCTKYKQQQVHGGNVAIQFSIDYLLNSIKEHERKEFVVIYRDWKILFIFIDWYFISVQNC